MRKAFVMLLLAGVAFAHETGSGSVWERLAIPDPLNAVYIAVGIAGFMIIASIYYKDHMGAHANKAAFIIIVVPIALATIYLDASTLYLNFRSESIGPVHWHADYEIWACGVDYEALDPHDLDNKVGTPMVHEHNDNRMHIEGTLLHVDDASIGKFFEAIDGEFTGDYMKLPTNEGIREWTNGDMCNGQTAAWHTFVNGIETEDAQNHIIAPYADVPPGDIIKLVFTEKSLDEINTKLFEVP